MIKELPDPVQITEDGSVQVIGWVDKRSFVVKILPEMPEPEVPVTTGIENENPVPLDSEEDTGWEDDVINNLEDEAEFLSLWNWAKDNGLTLSEFEELQTRLESYIDPEVE